jgi:sulfate permease, SulP family
MKTSSWRTSATAMLDGTAAALPLALGGTVILYGQVAPEWIPFGILATCLGLFVTHFLTARSQRPIPFSARFFEAVTLATMVQQMAARFGDWGLANTPELRVALMGLIITGSGGVVALLWGMRAERFVRFIPAPVYAGFSTSIAVALFINQAQSLWAQTHSSGQMWPVLLTVRGVLLAAVWVRKHHPHWPAAAVGLAAGVLIHQMLQLAGHTLPRLATEQVWTLPVAMADVGGVLAALGASMDMVAMTAQNMLILGILVFLNNVVIGQMLAQADDRQHVGRKDRALQSLALIFSGALGSAPLSGAPTAAVAATRLRPLGPVTLWGMAGITLAVYASTTLTWIPFAALTGIFLLDAWNLWDRSALKHATLWLRRQPLAVHAKEDLIVILGVLGAALLINMVAGLMVGLVLGLLLHAYRNTSTPVRKVWDGTQMQSNCARSRHELSTLGQHGRALRVFTLDSHQFFVSAALLTSTVKATLNKPQILRLILP